MDGWQLEAAPGVTGTADRAGNVLVIPCFGMRRTCHAHTETALVMSGTTHTTCIILVHAADMLHTCSGSGGFCCTSAEGESFRRLPHSPLHSRALSHGSALQQPQGCGSSLGPTLPRTSQGSSQPRQRLSRAHLAMAHTSMTCHRRPAYSRIQTIQHQSHQQGIDDRSP